jgi:pimeloyl-ACP methyl ester carboxylesterase
MKGIWNHLRCADYLCSRPEVDPERLGVIGHSLGGHNALFAAAFDERLKVVVSSCGWTPFHDYKGGKLEGWTSDRYMPRIRDAYGLDPGRVPFDFHEVVAAIAPRAFLSVSPLGDDNFAVAGVRKAIAEASRVYALLGVPDRLAARYPDCGHDFPPAERQATYAFIDRILKHEPPRGGEGQGEARHE